MNINQTALEILHDYFPVKNQNLDGKRKLKELIEKKLVGSLKEHIHATVFVSGHTQKGNWADSPWVGFHDKRINAAPQTGVYCAIIFLVDGTGLVISMQHGSDKIGVKELKDRVIQTRRELGFIPEGFSTDRIFLKSNKRGSRPERYERANIIGRQISVHELVTEKVLVSNELKKVLGVYDAWAGRVIAQDAEDEYQEDVRDSNKEDLDVFPPPRKNRYHFMAGTKSPPRDPLQGQAALKKAQYRCEADVNHGSFLTTKGHAFMEKHHLIPMEKYFDFSNSIDHFSNIYCLCPNCHRKIHHAEKKTKLGLVENLFKSREKIIYSNYKISLQEVLSYYF